MPFPARRLPPLGEHGPLNLGIAHGWGGVLFALLRWREARRSGGADTTIETYLRALAAEAEPAGDGLRWRWISGPLEAKDYMPGWCNGSAGRAFVDARRAFIWQGRIRRIGVACGVERLARDMGDLCCGAAVRSYAMLNLYRHGGDRLWLRRAQELASRAVTLILHRSMKRDSLYKGEVGVALLIADLARPELSCMPLFDLEP